MKIGRITIHAVSLVLLFSFASLSSGCTYVKKIIAKDKVNQGAILYNQGRTKEAQVFFKEATEIDKDSPIAWLYYGATLVKEYKEMSGEERVSKANEALKVYETAINLADGKCTTIDNAVSYIATIYDDLANQDKQREWLLKRAEGECATKEIKATTYYSIAVKFWNCSYDQTTRYADKAAQDPFHYRNMDYAAALPDKQRSGECVTKGLEFIEKALQVDPEYVDAMYYKGLLYRERQKLTKDEAERKRLDAMAVKITDEASAMQKKKEEAELQEAQQKAAAPQG